MSKSRSKNPARGPNPLLTLLPNPSLALSPSPSGGMSPVSETRQSKIDGTLAAGNAVGSPVLFVFFLVLRRYLDDERPPALARRFLADGRRRDHVALAALGASDREPFLRGRHAALPL